MPETTTGGYLSGALAIARALGYRSDETIKRHFAAGKLPGAFKGPCRNSPIKISRKDLARIRGNGDDDVEE